MCEVLGVVRSAYYDWLKGQNSPMTDRQANNAHVLASIEAIFEESHGSYGIKRIHRALLRKGVVCGESRVAKLMKQNNIRPYRRTKRPYYGKVDREVVADNLLNRQFKVEQPNQVWVTDMTYLRTEKGFAYLAAVLDLYSRAIVGWSLSDVPDTQLMIAATSQAVIQRNPNQPVMIHSDQGVQYTSKAFRNWCADKQLVPSMSRKGNCHDNAVMESFFSSLKKERIQGKSYISFDALHIELVNYIDHFYNKTRLHSSNNYLSPLEFKMNYTAK